MDPIRAMANPTSVPTRVVAILVTKIMAISPLDISNRYSARHQLVYLGLKEEFQCLRLFKLFLATTLTS